MKNSIFVSAGEFETFGGWVLDTQFIYNIGSSYLLAHGLGNPVCDAVTKIKVEKKGVYKIWAFTKDWVANWKQNVAPGLFKIKINGFDTEILGNRTKKWEWQAGGEVELDAGEYELSLVDLTGFEGRCAAVYLCSDTEFIPPSGKAEFIEFRRQNKDFNEAKDAGRYDIIIAGGGIAGMSNAISCAKNGLDVLLIQDRYVLGGNNSSEVRVWLGGETNFEPYPKIGDIVKSFEPAEHYHYGDKNTAEIYEDEKRLSMLRAYPNIKMMLGCVLIGAVIVDGKIESVKFADVKTFREYTAAADLFTDATGDATLGYYAGADFEITTNGHMGMTNVWHVTDTGKKTEFPALPWAYDMKDNYFPGRNAKDAKGTTELGGWYWESGMEYEPIDKAEEARDLNFRAMYGALDAIKNKDKNPTYDTYKIGNSCYIGGKRESRRLMGDIVLNKSDVLKNRIFPDSCVPCTWHIDVHYPKKELYPLFSEGDAFITNAYYDNLTAPYYLTPYRCLYSRNISNLFMAGRNVSVSHDALGTVRVMRTCGMMGEIIGYAAAVCRKYGVTPRDVYSSHLEEFLALLK